MDNCKHGIENNLASVGSRPRNVATLNLVLGKMIESRNASKEDAVAILHQCCTLASAHPATLDRGPRLDAAVAGAISKTDCRVVSVHATWTAVMLNCMSLAFW